MTIPEFLQNEIVGNTLLMWAIALAITVAIIFAAGVLRILLRRLFTRLATRTSAPLWSVLLAMLGRTKWLFVLIVAVFVGALALELPERTHKIGSTVVVLALLIQAGLWGAIALQVMIKHHQRQLEKDPASITTLNLLSYIGRFILWSIVLLLVLDNLGINITALVAGLGVGGIALALAVQTILSDLFASLSIVLDKPFVVGDFLIVGDLLGTVEQVGLKTTRLRSLSGEQLVFANADLLNSRIRNYGRMFERRVEFKIGVTYQTPRDKLAEIPGIIREAVEREDTTRFDRSHFFEYGDSALMFVSVYFVLGPDYNQYMDIQQAINLRIHERFEQEGIEFAYPTQTVFVQQAAQ
jgi:small-conductance mechanosensitive channel